MKRLQGKSKPAAAPKLKIADLALRTTCGDGDALNGLVLPGLSCGRQARDVMMSFRRDGQFSRIRNADADYQKSNDCTNTCDHL
jgi:hypothetical protein